MREWETRKLGDLCTRITVGHVGSMTSQYVVDGIPFLRSQNIKPGQIDLSSLKYINREFHDRLSKSQLHPGDLVIVRTGDPGTAAVIPDNLGPVNCSDLVIAKPRSNVDARFLCYAINETARGFIKAHTVGAVQQHFNVASAKELTLCVPSLLDQQAIAALLGALDDKIAANRNIVSKIDSLCLSLASEKLWTDRTRLDSLCVLHKHQVDPSTMTDDLVAHYSLPSFDSEKTAEQVKPNTIKSSKFIFSTPVVLLSKLNPDIPRVWNVHPDINIPALASTEFLVLEPREGISTHELWAVAAQLGFLQELSAKVTGTSKSHQRVRPAEVMTADVVDPRTLGPVRQKLESLALRAAAARAESLVLASLRDTLLPQLMSGRLRVWDAEHIVEDTL